MKSLAKLSFATATVATGASGTISSLFLFSAACASTAQSFNSTMAGYSAVLVLLSTAVLHKGYKVLKKVMAEDNALDSPPSLG